MALAIRPEDGGDPIQPTGDQIIVEVSGFEVAGLDGVFHPARCVLGGYPELVVVICDDVKEPRRVRYAWQNNTTGTNLINMEGLPASPFSLTVGEHDD